MEIIRHRANSVDKLREAKRQGCDWAEIDVHQNSEGALRCNHDIDGFDGPTLTYLLNEAAHLKLPLMVELKAGREDFAATAVETIRQSDALCMILSFDLELLYDCAILDPDIPLILNSKSRLPLPEDELKEHIWGIGAPLHEWKWHANAHSLPMFVYTVNNPGDIPAELRQGIAGIITDRPEAWPRSVTP